MKVYILKESDFDALLLALDRDPEHGYAGGSSTVLDQRERQIYSEAHRFYNYQIRTWIDKQRSDKG